MEGALLEAVQFWEAREVVCGARPARLQPALVDLVAVARVEAIEGVEGRLSDEFREGDLRRRVGSRVRGLLLLGTRRADAGGRASQGLLPRPVSLKEKKNSVPRVFLPPPAKDK